MFVECCLLFVGVFDLSSLLFVCAFDCVLWGWCIILCVPFCFALDGFDVQC